MLKREAPYSIVGTDGKQGGLLLPFFNHLSDLCGVSFVFVPFDTDHELKDALKDGRIDIIGMVGNNVFEAHGRCLSGRFRQGKESFMKDYVFPKGEENVAYQRYFIGKSYLAPLAHEQMQIANVTFEPACRNNWHIHHKGGQILLVTGGRGWYQEWGKSAQALKAGDVVEIPPEVKHWHGCTSYPVG